MRDRIHPFMCPRVYFAKYAAPWRSLRTRDWCDASPGTANSHFHIMSIVTRQHNHLDFERELSGILCERESGTLSFGNQCKMFTERRISLALTIEFEQLNPGAFVFVNLSDNSHPFGGPSMSYNLALSLAGLRPCNVFAGFAYFQYAILDELNGWESDWRETLRSVDELLSVQMGDYLLEKHRQKLMYDDYQLTRSEFYFSLLQLLRQFNDYIEQTAADVESLRQSMSTQLKEIEYQEMLFTYNVGNEIGIIQQNWKVVSQKHENTVKELIGIISRKTRLIESLRDGLFNAQSVREAVRGTQINQFLLVFTVVTILYLPPTFVATFYGMDLFVNEDNISASRTQFWIVFAAVSGATYILAIILVLSSAEQVRAVLASPAKLRDWFPGSKNRKRGSESKDKKIKKGHNHVGRDLGIKRRVRGLRQRLRLKKETKPEQQQPEV
ncbi:hypothetical protein QBC43DRAFT_317365 [Cladorrhinum sp. PSN259]|nr:hypothetical protein QBC43DRAFT_317365 [Cladorrhinum sp. PSN259]